MLRTLLCDEYNRFLVVEDAATISDILERKDRHLWLDLERPTPEELKLIEEEFKLHPLAIEDAAKRHQRPKIDQYEHFYFVVFYSVACEEPGQAATSAGRRGLKGTRFLGPEWNGGQTRVENEESRVSNLQQTPVSDPQPLLAIVHTPDEAQSPATLEISDERIVLRELSLFMSDNYLITVHEDPIPEFEEATRRWFRNMGAMTSAEVPHDRHVPGARGLSVEEAQALVPGRHEMSHPVVLMAQEAAVPAAPAVALEPAQPREGATPKPEHTSDIGVLLYSLLDTIVDNYFPVIDTIAERVEDLEEQIFEKFDQKAIEDIFTIKKDLLAMRKVLAPERDVLNILTRRDLPLFEQHTIIYFQDVYDHVVRITDSIDTYRDLLSSALDSFLSMQSNRLNITVQTLTSWSLMLMSVAAITGWYGMNFDMMPELASRLGYPGVMVAVATIVTLEFIFFRRKGWL